VALNTPDDSYRDHEILKGVAIAKSNNGKIDKNSMILLDEKNRTRLTIKNFRGIRRRHLTKEELEKVEGFLERLNTHPNTDNTEDAD
jgi:hypothetical protein